MSKDAAEIIWQRAGDGNPLALALFAGRSRDADPEELASRLPEATDNVNEWIALALDGLASDGMTVAKIIAFNYEPIPRDIVGVIAAPLDPDRALSELTARFLAKENAGRFEMHSAVREYITSETTEAEHEHLAQRFTDHYREHARTVFIDGLGPDEPSYGKLYL